MSGRAVRDSEGDTVQARVSGVVTTRVRQRLPVVTQTVTCVTRVTLSSRNPCDDWSVAGRAVNRWVSDWFSLVVGRSRLREALLPSQEYGIISVVIV